LISHFVLSIIVAVFIETNLDKQSDEEERNIENKEEKEEEEGTDKTNDDYDIYAKMLQIIKQQHK
jgi:hypothetical protein